MIYAPNCKKQGSEPESPRERETILGARARSIAERRTRCALTAGLIQPTGPFPRAIRASFTAAMSEATIGADALVPPPTTKSPATTMAVGYLPQRRNQSALYKLESDRGQCEDSHPFADMSGYARPERLNTSGTYAGPYLVR